MFTTMSVFYTDQFEDTDAGYYLHKGPLFESRGRVIGEGPGISRGHEQSTWRESLDADVEAALWVAHW